MYDSATGAVIRREYLPGYEPKTPGAPGAAAPAAGGTSGTWNYVPGQGMVKAP